jgi:hypothetical protein
MGFIEDTLAAPRPDALAALDLPRRQQYHPSPGAVRLVANPGRRGGTLHSQPERADGSRCGRARLMPNSIGRILPSP